MRRAQHDLAILGAGCFATLLVQRLRWLGWSGKMLLLDQREQFDQMQRWCWWRHQEDSQVPVHGITREWSRYLFRTGGGQWQSRNLREWRYAHVDSRQFYTRSHEDWQGDENIDLQLGTTVEDVSRSADGSWRIATSAGEAKAGAVIDCRSLAGRLPQHSFEPGDGWWQSFEGRVVDEAVPVLDDRTFCLMDIDPWAPTALGFGYLLGLDAERTLVEYTTFDTRAVDRHSLGRELSHYLNRLGIGGVNPHPSEQEFGWLPMTTKPLARGGRQADAGQPVRAGVAGGAARPASGYAFARMMRQSTKVAAAVVAGSDLGRGDAGSHRVWINRLDSVFLRTLGARPDLAPRSFSRLLEGLSGDQMASFMAERPGPSTLLKVLSVLPKTPFLRGAWQQWRHRGTTDPLPSGTAPLRRVPT